MGWRRSAPGCLRHLLLDARPLGHRPGPWLRLLGSAWVAGIAPRISLMGWPGPFLASVAWPPGLQIGCIMAAPGPLGLSSKAYLGDKNTYFKYPELFLRFVLEIVLKTRLKFY